MRVIESQIYEADFRAIEQNSSIKVYSSASSTRVENSLTFDRDSKEPSSFDLLTTSVVSEIMLNMIETFTNEGEDLLDLECKAKVSLSNPLTLANVKGYDEISKIVSLELKVYYYSFLEEEESKELFAASLLKCPIYQTLKEAFPITIKLSQLY